jgi:hypothetical protein
MALFTAKVKEMSQTVRVKYLIHNKEIWAYVLIQGQRIV